MQGNAVNADRLLGGINPRAQLGDDAAIDFDAAGGDQFLALSPAAEPCRGQHFLQTLQAIAGGRLRLWGRRGDVSAGGGGWQA